MANKHQKLEPFSTLCSGLGDDMLRISTSATFRIFDDVPIV